MMRIILNGFYALASLTGGVTVGAPTVLNAQAEVASDIPPDFGVLVMAHGGDDNWNKSVLEATSKLAGRIPTVVAFGMADRESLASALDSLGRLGRQRIAVVRLFLSGRSFLQQTEFLLGLSSHKPGWFAGTSADKTTRIDHQLSVATHFGGLMDSELIHDVMVDRVRKAADSPSSTAVLLLAHGMGDSAQNAEVIEQMALINNRLDTLGFADSEAITLREDWPEHRAAAEIAIRRFVDQQSSQGRLTVVAPFRLSGFGPYDSVLNGLPYQPTGSISPDNRVGEWIEMTALGIGCRAGWLNTEVKRCSSTDDLSAQSVDRASTGTR